MRLKPILCALLLFVLALPAVAQTDSHLELAKKSIEKTVKVSDEDLSELRQMIQVWKQKCGNQDNFCVIRECDYLPTACRKNHILLFRGESALYSAPGSSSLMRAIINESAYSKGKTTEETLKQYSFDLGVLKDFDFAPQKEETLLKVNPKSGEHEWFWKNGEKKIYPYSRADHRRTAPLASYLFHVEASYPYFQDSASGTAIGIDPLISTSTSPTVATAFSKTLPNSKGRVLVYSVSENNMISMCDDFATLIPGTVLDPRRCDINNEFDHESEFDLVLYANPNWIYRSFIVNGTDPLK